MAFVSSSIVVVLSVMATIVTYRIVARYTHTRPAPESATGLRQVKPQRFDRSVVVSAHPDASRVGAQVLAHGGTAMDAAVAVQLVLGLVEPQSSGLGGGGFLVYYDAADGRIRAYDGREMAPSGASADLFLDEDGEPLSFPAAMLGGRSVGVPGMVRMLELGHRNHGRLPWRSLFEGAISLASEGFEVSPRLSRLISLDPVLPAMAPANDYFYPEGSALVAGEERVNAPYAKVLEALRDGGWRSFYRGAVARDIVKAVGEAKRPSLARGVLNLVMSELGLGKGGRASVAAAGPMKESDLAGYEAKEREPLCAKYRSYRVCGMPPPSGGGIAVLQALKLLEQFDLAKLAPLSTDALHVLSEAERLVDADRETWVGDPDFVPVPTEGLLSEAYLRSRSRLLGLKRKLEKVEPGHPPGAKTVPFQASAPEVPSTTHFTIVDQSGNVASVTSSIEFGFGSHTFVDGFLLNNQLTDFSFAPTKNGQPDFNAVAANKRPRSSMSPTIVFDDASGSFVGALGSPGGTRIVAYVIQTLVALIDWRLSPQEAVSLPHVVAHGGTTELEDVGWPGSSTLNERVAALESRGHDIDVGEQNSGLHVVWRTKLGLEAGVDPRREGQAFGE